MKVWSRKELENYLLDGKLIHAYLCRDGAEIAFDKIESIVETVIAELAEDLPVLIADAYQAADRKLSLPTAMKMAKAVIKERHESGVLWRDIVAGKKAVSMISQRCQAEWATQISAMSLCRYMRLDEVPHELRQAVESLV